MCHSRPRTRPPARASSGCCFQGARRPAGSRSRRRASSPAICRGSAAVRRFTLAWGVVRALPGRLSVFSVLYSAVYGTFVWARAALNSPTQRFLAWAVVGVASLEGALLEVCPTSPALFAVTAQRKEPHSESTSGVRGARAQVEPSQLGTEPDEAVAAGGLVCGYEGVRRELKQLLNRPYLHRGLWCAPRGPLRCVCSFLQHSPGKYWHFPVKLAGNAAVISKRTRRQSCGPVPFRGKKVLRSLITAAVLPSHRREAMGQPMPTGLLLHGPSGCGKVPRAT